MQITLSLAVKTTYVCVVNMKLSFIIEASTIELYCIVIEKINMMYINDVYISINNDEKLIILYVFESRLFLELNPL